MRAARRAGSVTEQAVERRRYRGIRYTDTLHALRNAPPSLREIRSGDATRKWHKRSAAAATRGGDDARMSVLRDAERAYAELTDARSLRCSGGRARGSRMRISIVIPSKGAKRARARSRRCVVTVSSVTSRPPAKPLRDKYESEIRLVDTAYRMLQIPLACVSRLRAGFDNLEVNLRRTDNEVYYIVKLRIISNLHIFDHSSCKNETRKSKGERYLDVLVVSNVALREGIHA